ncbi:MAG: hypothetical protein ACI9G1_003082, partial [Pirellulaceae bacterium]
HLAPLDDSLEGNNAAVVKAIEEFQGKNFSFKPDGRVDPGGNTIRKLKIAPKDSFAVIAAVENILTNLIYGSPIAGVDNIIWQAALLRMLHHVNHDKLRRFDVFTIVDFRKSILEKRLWVVNLDSATALIHVHCAHGSGSGGMNGKPTQFQDDTGSHKSNLGGYATLLRARSGAGHLEKMGLPEKGTSLGIEGLDPTNKKTRSRQIIFHGASYVRPDKAPPKVGRSWGCFATHPDDNERIVSRIQDGSFVYSYAGEDKKP